MSHLDLLSDIFQRIQDHGRKLTPKIIESVEQEICENWGGERVYIPRQGESGKLQMDARNRAIRADFHRGEHPELLATRYGLGVKRIRQIVAD